MKKERGYLIFKIFTYKIFLVIVIVDKKFYYISIYKIKKVVVHIMEDKK